SRRSIRRSRHHPPARRILLIHCHCKRIHPIHRRQRIFFFLRRQFFCQPRRTPPHIQSARQNSFRREPAPHAFLHHAPNPFHMPANPRLRVPVFFAPQPTPPNPHPPPSPNLKQSTPPQKTDRRRLRFSSPPPLPPPKKKPPADRVIH